MLKDLGYRFGQQASRFCHHRQEHHWGQQDSSSCQLLTIIPADVNMNTRPAKSRNLSVLNILGASKAAAAVNTNTRTAKSRNLSLLLFFNPLTLGSPHWDWCRYQDLQQTSNQTTGIYWQKFERNPTTARASRGHIGSGLYTIPVWHHFSTLPWNRNLIST